MCGAERGDSVVFARGDGGVLREAVMGAGDGLRGQHVITRSLPPSLLALCHATPRMGSGVFFSSFLFSGIAWASRLAAMCTQHSLRQTLRNVRH
eukprot:445738-Rhodomonas_salina.1